jgi:hypothetical protein
MRDKVAHKSIKYTGGDIRVFDRLGIFLPDSSVNAVRPACKNPETLEGRDLKEQSNSRTATRSGKAGHEKTTAPTVRGKRYALS